MVEKSRKDGKLLEKIVAEMCLGIKDAKVRHNAKISGKLTKTERQIDVLVEGKYGFVDVVIEIEAKDYSRPVSIIQVESFISKVQDTGANLGVMVCSKGFTIGARTRAAASNIQLFEVFSEELKNTPFLIPLRMVVPEIKSWAVGVEHKVIGPFSMPSDLSRIRVVIDGEDLTLEQLLFHAWNNNKIPNEAGNHRVSFGAVTIKDISDPKFMQYCEVYFDVGIEEEYYLKIFPASFLKSVKDGNNRYFLNVPLPPDQDVMKEMWQQFATMEELNNAACIKDQPQDVQNLLIRPFYTLGIKKECSK